MSEAMAPGCKRASLKFCASRTELSKRIFLTSAEPLASISKSLEKTIKTPINIINIEQKQDHKQYCTAVQLPKNERRLEGLCWSCYDDNTRQYVDNNGIQFNNFLRQLRQQLLWGTVPFLHDHFSTSKLLDLADRCKHPNNLRVTPTTWSPKQDFAAAMTTKLLRAVTILTPKLWKNIRIHNMWNQKRLINWM